MKCDLVSPTIPGTADCTTASQANPAKLKAASHAAQRSRPAHSHCALAIAASTMYTAAAARATTQPQTCSATYGMRGHSHSPGTPRGRLLNHSTPKVAARPVVAAISTSRLAMFMGEVEAARRL